MLTPCPAQIQDLAIRCVQKNIKKNKGVKDWPWWKLFTTVRPLIQVQLTEDQIRGKDVGIHAGGCWMEQGGLGGALGPGQSPIEGWDAGPHWWGQMQKLTVGWNAGSCSGVGSRTQGRVGRRILWWVRIQDPTVGWDAGAHDGVRCTTTSACAPPAPGSNCSLICESACH